MNNMHQSWFANPPKFWFFVCALSGAMLALMLMNYGKFIFIICAILAAAINTYNFPKLIAKKSILSGIVFLVQSSVLIGVIGCGVMSGINNVALTYGSVGELCVIVLICQVVSFYLMQVWSKIK